jgi:hypothetical protein
MLIQFYRILSNFFEKNILSESKAVGDNLANFFTKLFRTRYIHMNIHMYIHMCICRANHLISVFSPLAL